MAQEKLSMSHFPMQRDLSHARSIEEGIFGIAASELGIENFSPADQEEIISSFGAVALQAATVAILSALPEAKREEFAELSEQNDQGGIQAFLAREVPDYEARVGAAVAEEVRRFREFAANLNAGEAGASPQVTP